MFGKIRRSRVRKNLIESEKDARIEHAERHLRELQDRSDKALTTLNERDSRNHWREAIQQMIQGAH